MSPMPTLPSTASAPWLRDRPMLRGPQKSNSDRTLDGGNAGDERSFESRNNGRRCTDPSHFGTASAAPLWNGPRLRPAFVAQVLGQVLMDDNRSRMSPAAYPHVAQIAPGAFFDAGV